MRELLLMTILVAAAPLVGATNYNDDLDKNSVSAPFEEREQEVLNSGDAFDENYTPATLEDRAQEEQIESDVIPDDDPEKGYDPLDQEADEL